MTFTFILKALASFCIFCSVYLYLENLKLKKRIRTNNWLNYHRITSTITTLDEIILLYKGIHKTNLNTQVLEPLIRADSNSKEFSKGIIHQIQMLEPSFGEEDFTTWLSEGKIDEESLRVFRAIKLTNPDRKPLSEKVRERLRKFRTRNRKREKILS